MVQRGLLSLCLALLFASSGEAFVLSPALTKAAAAPRSLRSGCFHLRAEALNSPGVASEDLVRAQQSATFDRRNFVGYGSAALGTLLGLDCGFLSEANAAETDAVVTQKVYMDIRIQGVNAASKGSSGRDSNLDKQAAMEGRIVIGLFGNDAPETVAAYQQLFAGTLVRPCQDIQIEGATARELLQKQAPLKKCKAAADRPINLEESQVWRILKDKRIDFGRLKGKFLLREAPTTQDSNSLTHDRQGRVSTKRGGGQFEFAIAPNASPELDKNNIVFGQVLEGVELINKLNETPVKQFAGNLGGGKEEESSAGSVCYYGGKDAFCGANKPLQRIIVVKAGLL